MNKTELKLIDAIAEDTCLLKKEINLLQKMYQML